MQKLSHPHWDRSCIRHHLGLSVWSRISPNVYRVFNGPDDFNGYGYFPVRLYRTEAGFQAPMPMKKVALVSRSLDLFFCASSGFGADFSQISLLTTYRPDLLHLPTTNGEHCTGDVTNMGEAIGTITIDLEWVQVHPTGLVKPYDAAAKIKFLPSEALRGVGYLLV